MKKPSFYRIVGPFRPFYDDLHLTFDFIAGIRYTRIISITNYGKTVPAITAGSLFRADQISGGEGEDKYKAIAEYLYKVVREKQETNELDCFTSFTGNAYNSECLLAWMDERLALEENFL